MRASEASEKKIYVLTFHLFVFIQPFCTSNFKDFFLQNTKFGVRVPFALLLAYRVPGFGVPNTLLKGRNPAYRKGGGYSLIGRTMNARTIGIEPG